MAFDPRKGRIYLDSAEFDPDRNLGNQHPLPSVVRGSVCRRTASWRDKLSDGANVDLARDAMLHASQWRLRPIFMTAAATICYRWFVALHLSQSRRNAGDLLPPHATHSQ
jgi:hypothetical protein